MYWGGAEKTQNQKIQIKTKIPHLVTHPFSLLKTGTPTVFRDSETSQTAPMWRRSYEIGTKQNVRVGARIGAVTSGRNI